MPSITTGPRVRPWVNVVALVVVLAVNGLAESIPLNGVTAGEVSAEMPSTFTPASYVFGIWSIIYLLLIVFAVFQALPSQRDNPRLNALGGAFAASCAGNALFVVAQHYRLWWLTQLGVLITLGAIALAYRRLGIGTTPAPHPERLMVRPVFSIYLGWATVATVANTIALLGISDVPGAGDGSVWTLLGIVVATGLGLAVLTAHDDGWFPAVLVWAFVGIAVARGTLGSIAALVAVVAALLLVVVTAWWLLSRRGRSTTTGRRPALA